MLDAFVRPMIDPPLNATGPWLARHGAGANTVTLAGFALGIAGAAAIALHHPLVGLIFVIASRIADGLDGAIARATRPSDMGGYLDIVCDFLFYGAVPFAFVVADLPPTRSRVRR
ncbi:CDP-alcohol phosphatidyltransferase family protein [Breoghania sp.]|uniref:CDP-alcohol phosphatidyltransferase family protein n=1 Tax=Breoghania sp. TaxID=2065378 RepID=UPI003204F427